jgi:hypothetical protein
MGIEVGGSASSDYPIWCNHTPCFANLNHDFPLQGLFVVVRSIEENFLTLHDRRCATMEIFVSCLRSSGASQQSDEIHPTPPTHPYRGRLAPDTFESDQGATRPLLWYPVRSESSYLSAGPVFLPLIDEAGNRLPDEAGSLFRLPPSIEIVSSWTSVIIANTIYSIPSEETLLKPYIQHATKNRIPMLVPHWHTVLQHLIPRSVPTKAFPYLHPALLYQCIPGPVDRILQCLLDVSKQSALTLHSVVPYYFVPLMYILFEESNL